ncbi:MAG TPA: hypothetical protein VJV78_35290 [Polyangiales bacterium]|nr:hypothetical protein [Polyangiales bacterium]
MPALRLALCSLLIAACSGAGGERHDSDLTKLSARGLYSDIGRRRVVKEAFEYTPDYALWSDAADKRRWLILPRGERVDTSDMAHWMFPVGTKLFKEFSHDGKLLETRLVERIADSGFFKNDYFMGTFIWRRDQSDAILTAEGQDNVLGTEHDVPRQKACPNCHRGEPGAMLGFSAVQLSASGTLERVAKRGMLSAPPDRSYELPGDEIEKAALGYIHANCGHCHNDVGEADFMHLRISPQEVDGPVAELEAYKQSVGVELSDEWEDHPERFSKRIVPGDPELSAIAYRMGQRGDDELVPDQMPPIATRKVDEQGLAAVRTWIQSLHQPPMDAADGGPQVDAGQPDAEAPDASSPVPDAGKPTEDATHAMPPTAGSTDQEPTMPAADSGGFGMAGSLGMAGRVAGAAGVSGGAAVSGSGGGTVAGTGGVSGAGVGGVSGAGVGGVSGAGVGGIGGAAGVGGVSGAGAGGVSGAGVGGVGGAGVGGVGGAGSGGNAATSGAGVGGVSGTGVTGGASGGGGGGVAGAGGALAGAGAGGVGGALATGGVGGTVSGGGVAAGGVGGMAAGVVAAEPGVGDGDRDVDEDVDEADRDRDADEDVDEAGDRAQAMGAGR